MVVVMFGTAMMGLIHFVMRFVMLLVDEEVMVVKRRHGHERFEAIQSLSAWTGQ